MPKQNGQNRINLQHKNPVAIPLSVPYQTFAHAMLVMADVRSSELIGLPDTLTIAFPAIFSRHLKPLLLSTWFGRMGSRTLWFSGALIKNLMCSLWSHLNVVSSLEIYM